MEEFAYPNYPASHDAPPNRFSDLPFEHSHLAAVTPTTYAASRPSTADASQHSTWPYYLDSPTPAYTANQLPYNYAEAPYDFGEYPDIPHASEDPRTFQQPAIYLPQASYYPTKPWYYLESSNSPTTEYTLSPVDGHSNGGYFSSISDFEDAPPDPFAYLTPPSLNNSTYSELSHALDEPLPPPIPPAVEVPRFEPEPTQPALVHPADLDEPPMAFLRPDSPGGVSPDGRSSMSIEPVGSPPIESVPTPQSPEQLPAAGSSTAMNVQVEPAPLRASESHRMTKRKRVTPRLKTPEPVAAPSSPLTPTAAATSPGPTHATIPQEPTAGVGSSKPKKKKRARAAVPDDEDEDAENSKRRKKPSLACLFCRERKIACSLPEEGAEDKRCNQCVKRSRECEMPAESRRGHYQRKLKDKSQQPNASAVMFVEEEPLAA